MDSSPFDKTYDVAVFGTSLTDTALAAALAQSGKSVIQLDKVRRCSSPSFPSRHDAADFEPFPLPYSLFRYNFLLSSLLLPLICISMARGRGVFLMMSAFETYPSS